MGIFVVLPLLYICEPFHRIRLGTLREDRIGHLATNTELWMRLRQRDGSPSNSSTFFVCWNPANRQLLEMWKRKIKVVESKVLKRAYIAIAPILARTRFAVTLPEMPVIEHEAFLNASPALSFTDEEREKGFNELSSWGVSKDDWYVCFHARDPVYLGTREGFGEQKPQTSYFDCSIENFIPAMKWVVEQGGVAIRVGHLVRDPLPDLGPRVIDYATRYRSDFMDVFLPAHCRYFVGNTSGLFCISRIFNVPIVHTNNCPFPWAGTRIKRNLDVPKLLRRKGDQRHLTLIEIKRLGLLECHRDEPDRLLRIFKESVYDELDLEWLENEPVDILNACMDMEDLIKGIAPPAHSHQLQEAFNGFYDKAPPSPHKGRISARFALRHEEIIAPTELK